ncbi:serine/arginine repetitive matrix protein 2 [Episyrphus balteatus]|uniref:serine/arginine repetitive matrix protein 2 n=1 Tax=Episyrphus balteatus TaxID=286459 RepID=UPI00248582C4|nr:serine/arginine repetitive matrix protein 2 [Episyrphus balteatus]
MSNPSSLNAINKIHINSSTKMTLSDRFTAFSAQPKINPRTTRRGIDSPVSRVASIANRRLLKQLAQKHTMEAALKLKRRSMKTRSAPTAAFKRVNNGQPLKRGTIKALRLGPNGRPLKANSISNVATMEADLMGRPTTLRRSNSVTRIADRIGGKRPQGARFPRRAGARPVWGTASVLNSNREPLPPARMRSRSRSRTRQPVLLSPRLSQPGVSGRLARGRSNSRSRPMVRSRSRSRNDRMNRMTEVRGANALPITSRLGRRQGAAGARTRSASRAGTSVARRPLRGGVASGRIQKRRNSVKAVRANGGATLATRSGVQSRLSRPKGRLAAAATNQRLNRSASKRGNAARGRARSRSRADNRPLQRSNSAARGGAAVANRQRGGGAKRGRTAVRNIGGRRGRSQQRGGATAGGAQRNGNGQQQRRGRSRSRGRGSARGGRQLGNDKPDVKKEDLDKELDQYMSSTKSSDGLFT